MTEQTETMATTDDQVTDAHKLGDDGVRRTHPTSGDATGKPDDHAAGDQGQEPESLFRGAAKKSTGKDSRGGSEKPDDEPESFPREYVQKLREEAAEARVKAKSAETLAQRLHTSLVAADGRLVAPDELPFDAAHLEDPEALQDAITALIEAKPYLAGRTAWGNVGQGARASSDGDVDLAGILRSRV